MLFIASNNLSVSIDTNMVDMKVIMGKKSWSPALIFVCISISLFTIYDAIRHNAVKDTTIKSFEKEAKKKSTKFLSYQILRNFPFNQTYVEDYTRCDGNDRALLNDTFFMQPGMLDFNTLVDTNLNILYVGSSVGMQFAQGFQEATKAIKRQVIRYASRSWKGYHENTYISQTVDGGTVGALRITGLLLTESKGRTNQVAPREGGGWIESDARELKRLAHTWRHVDTLMGYDQSRSSCENPELLDSRRNNTTVDTSDQCEEENLDVIVHQIPVSKKFII